MLQRFCKSRTGFTLIELAIVLAIAGLLFAGLWRLMSGGNQQLRDQAAASSQSQLISGVKSFLASTDGQTYMTNNTNCGGNCAAGANFALSLPSAANPGGSAGCHGDANLSAMTASEKTTWCGYMPNGTSAATTNSYGQVYNIRILRDATAAGTAPNTYSFMIVTSGGDVIPDTSGGRITTMIGGDGGFVYSSNVCNGTTGAATNLSACGAYGAWAVSTGTYGFNAGYSGSVASRTYYAPEQSSTTIWLARQQFPGDATFVYNTMTVPLYMGGKDLDLGSYASPLLATGGSNLNLQGATLNMSNATSTAGGGAFNLQAGTINMDGGTISGTSTSSIVLNGDATTLTPEITANNNATCTMTAPNTPNTCPYAVSATTVNVSNLLNASSLYAGTFIYQSSDLRLKSNIQPIHNSLEDIMRLKPVSFTFKSNGKEGLGVIAQDVEKVYPQLVVPGVDGMKAVNYEGFIAPLIDSIQQLKLENDQLREDLQAQKRREEKLEREIQHSPN